MNQKNYVCENSKIKISSKQTLVISFIIILLKSFSNFELDLQMTDFYDS